LLRSATTTPFISGLLVFGFVMLVIGSFQLSLAILLTIALCTGVAFFFFVTMGWGLGVIEGLCATILVGLNVDYTLHIAIAYTRAPAPDRLGKVAFALGHMGPTVCAAAATTAAASLLLLPCQIVLFHRFGFVMAANTLVGAGLSLTLFPCLLLQMGPEGSLQGSCWGRICVAIGGPAAHDNTRDTSDHGSSINAAAGVIELQSLEEEEEALEEGGGTLTATEVRQV